MKAHDYGMTVRFCAAGTALLAGVLGIDCTNFGPGPQPVQVQTGLLAPPGSFVDSSPTSKSVTFPNVDLKMSNGTVLATVSGFVVTVIKTNSGGANVTRVTVDGTIARQGHCTNGSDGQRFTVVLRNDANGMVRQFITDPLSLTISPTSAALEGVLIAPIEEFTTMAVAAVFIRPGEWVRCGN